MNDNTFHLELTFDQMQRIADTCTQNPDLFIAWASALFGSLAEAYKALEDFLIIESAVNFLEGGTDES